MAWQDARGEALAARVARAAAAWQSGAPAHQVLAGDDFNQLALEIFAFQYRRVPPYRRYCQRLGRTPERVQRWQAIPAVPAPVFKARPIVCQDPAACEITFRTSGTSAGAAGRGQHHMVSLALYERVLLAGFRRIVRPQLSPLPRIIILHPQLQLRPDSSLGHYFHTLAKAHGQGAPTWGLTSQGLEPTAIVQALAAAQAEDRPVWLLTTTTALVGLLRLLVADGRRYRLPHGTLVLDTGGFKGAARAMPPAELRRRASERLGCAPAQIINQYGMTELSSQFYDAVRLEGAAGTPRIKVGPPWVRVQVLHPEELRPLPEGEAGLIQVHDLANVGSAAAVLTADLGEWHRLPAGLTPWPGWQQGFHVCGRARGAAARGCSLVAEELLAGSGGGV